MHLPPAPDEFFFNFMLTMARRLDEAHALCASALRELGDRPDEPFIRTRSRIFDAVGKAELMCVSLSLVMELLDIAPSRLSLSTPVPEEVNDMSNTVRVCGTPSYTYPRWSLGGISWKNALAVLH